MRSVNQHDLKKSIQISHVIFSVNPYIKSKKVRHDVYEILTKTTQNCSYYNLPLAAYNNLQLKSWDHRTIDYPWLGSTIPTAP